MPGDSGDKTEKATPKKRRDARKKGNVPKSQDITNLVSMLAMGAALKLFIPGIVENVISALYYFIDVAAERQEYTMSFIDEVYFRSMILFAAALAPLLLIAVAAGVLATGVQTRFLMTFESVKPKFSKLNPLKGIKNMFSLRVLVELLKNIIKFILIGIVVFAFVSSNITVFARMLDMSVPASAAYLFDTVFTMWLIICMFFAIVAVADFFYQRFDYEKNLKMSKQEVKEEYKQTEGDPKIKGKIRQIQMQMAQARMMSGVPEADVIIRNPTHYAIALKYDAERDIAPKVVAKGVDYQALRIVKIGEQNGVYIKEDPELTRAIYAATDIGDVIPYEFYNAVADLLAFVYRMNQMNEKQAQVSGAK